MAKIIHWSDECFEAGEKKGKKAEQERILGMLKENLAYVRAKQKTLYTNLYNASLNGKIEAYEEIEKLIKEGKI